MSINIKKIFSNTKCKKGQSLFEVIVAVGLVSVIMVALLSLSTVGVRNSSFSRNNVIATKYVQEATEWIRSERDTDWNDFVTHVGVTKLGGLDWSNLNTKIGSTAFSRSVKFTCKYDDGSGPVNKACNLANLIDVEVTVTWQDSQGTHEVKSLSNLTRWR